MRATLMIVRLLSTCIAIAFTACSSERVPDHGEGPADIGGDAGGFEDGSGSVGGDATAAGNDLGDDASQEPCAPNCAWPSRDRTVVRIPATANDELYVVRDENMMRTLPLVVRFPNDEQGALPVVIWSHGGGFANDGHTASAEWGDVLAAHGFVVIHVGHVELTDDSRRELCAFARVAADECVPGELSFGTIARPRDLIAVLDELPEIEAWVGERGGPDFDPERVAIAGHSAGSQGGLVLGGAVRNLSSSVTRYDDRDQRPIATVGLSPQGPGHNGFFAEGAETSWDEVDLPVLLVTGVSDINRGNSSSPDGPNRRQAWDNLPGSGAQYLLYAHTTTPTPPLARTTRSTWETSTVRTPS